MRIKNTNLYKFASIVKQWLKKLLNTIYYFIKFRGDFILIDSWVEQWFGKVQPRNFGDELNIYMIQSLTGKHVLNASNTLLVNKRYMVIGSIVEVYSKSNSIIWGSGAITGGSRRLSHVPLQINAVRGRYTRDYLISNGVHCPEVYGDPALLLPLIYKSYVDKKYQYGFIPHVEDLNNPIVMRFMEKYKDRVHLISFQGYGDWHDVIDEINACEVVISSSLHGLILSDAYGIPNVWLKISDKIIGGEFKFRDYFSGVNREYRPPFRLTESSELSELKCIADVYIPIDFDYNRLIDSCPFNLNISN